MGIDVPGNARGRRMAMVTVEPLERRMHLSASTIVASSRAGGGGPAAFHAMGHGGAAPFRKHGPTIANVNAVVAENSVTLTWDGSAATFTIELYQDRGPYLILGTTSAHTFTETGTNPFESHQYAVIADPYRGASDAWYARFPAFNPGLIADPVNPVTVSYDPMGLDGGTVTIRAITRFVDNPLPQGMTASWDTGTDLDTDMVPVGFSTFDTGDPLTKGIIVTHRFADGGTYWPVLVYQAPDGYPYVLLFGPVSLPGHALQITTPATVVSYRHNTYLDLTVGPNDPFGRVFEYRWSVIQSPGYARTPELLLPILNGIATFRVTDPGDYRFRVEVVTVGGLVSKSYVKVRIGPRGGWSRMDLLSRER